MFIKIAKRISVKPRLKANASSPREVSRTILVVITLVIFAILPPTIITAPTSERALPSPVMTIINKSNLHSLIIV